MNPRLKQILVLLAFVAVLCFSAFQNQRARQTGHTGGGLLAPSGFDFYVLSLSWSPTFCEEEAGGDNQQCGTSKPYAFVVHGLWPQNERGYPEFCFTKFNSRLAKRAADDMLDIMPSRDLVYHQWRKHGSCSALSPDAFFALTRKAREQITIPRQYMALANYVTIAPQDVERAFIGANPSLQQNAIAVTCSNRYLKEVRICMDKSLAFRPCPEVDSKSCSAAKTVMPPVRG